MTISISLLILMAVALMVVLQIVLLARRSGGTDDVTPKLDAVLKLQNEREGRMREDLKGLREETVTQGRELRQEVGDTLKRTGDSLVRAIGEISSAQSERLQT